LVLSCLSTDPRARPSTMKGVEKAIALFLTDEQAEAALAERVELVKRFAPEVPQHLRPADPMIIATEDVQSHLIERPRKPLLLLGGGLAVGVLLCALGLGLFHARAPEPAAEPSTASSEPAAPPTADEPGDEPQDDTLAAPNPPHRSEKVAAKGPSRAKKHHRR